MDHRSCSVPGRVPWSQPILRMDITPNVILDKGYSSALRVTSATSRLRMSPWPMPVQAAEDGKKCHPRKNRLLPTSPFQGVFGPTPVEGPLATMGKFPAGSPPCSVAVGRRLDGVRLGVLGSTTSFRFSLTRGRRKTCRPPRLRMRHRGERHFVPLTTHDRRRQCRTNSERSDRATSTVRLTDGTTGAAVRENEEWCRPPFERGLHHGTSSG